MEMGGQAWRRALFVSAWPECQSRLYRSAGKAHLALLSSVVLGFLEMALQFAVRSHLRDTYSFYFRLLNINLQNTF